MPVALVATAGTVNTRAVDPIAPMADLAAELHQPSHDIERLDGLARSVRELGDRIAGHR